MWYWIIASVLLVLSLLGLWYEITNQLGRKSEHMEGADPQTAEELRRLRWEIDRGRDAGQGFIPL
jgi:hypothetical protein